MTQDNIEIISILITIIFFTLRPKTNFKIVRPIIKILIIFKITIQIIFIRYIIRLYNYHQYISLKFCSLLNYVKFFLKLKIVFNFNSHKL